MLTYNIEPYKIYNTLWQLEYNYAFLLKCWLYFVVKTENLCIVFHFTLQTYQTLSNFCLSDITFLFRLNQLMNALYYTIVYYTILYYRESVLIPCIPLIPCNYPFEFKCLQFPVNICFFLTINKLQVQTLQTARVELSSVDVFYQ